MLSYLYDVILLHSDIDKTLLICIFTNGSEGNHHIDKTNEQIYSLLVIRLFRYMASRQLFQSKISEYNNVQSAIHREYFLIEFIIQ